MSLNADDIPPEFVEWMQQKATSLEPIEPAEAIDQYLEHRRETIQSQTIEEYRQKLSCFEEFCSKNGIENLNDLDVRELNKYRKYRRSGSLPNGESLAPKTMRDDMYLLRDFVEFLEGIRGVSPKLSEKVCIPELANGEGIRDVEVESERVQTVLEYLSKYKYATRMHVVWVFLAHTGRRISGLYALDVDDLHLEQEDPFVELRNRPNETELKNRKSSEGQIFISQEVAQIFKDYIDQNRISVTTENGRSPFLTSDQGRLSKTSIRRYVYKFSRPCFITGNCPHDQEIDVCDAANKRDSMSQCPSSKSPHDLKHGYITSKRRQGVPRKVLAERCDVSPEVMEKHYDERDEQERREHRQQIFNQIQENQSSEGYL